ncbi:hypothetical protein M8C21_005317 [Ambrosia artemisiifolia]|uniref:SBP-type domain-containing protein n=1 Tax=Ambrosia artemisiifolia TaxID=4212 RepID=A0AAD5GB29_AMBAR|nr:hypothetical protein M8C21_005317 [Ambrosia artemisiifolia]
MDWAFTPSSSWDLTELDIDDFDVLPEKNQDMDLEGFSSSDILGDGIDGIEGILNGLSEQKHSVMPSSPSCSSKKPRVESSEQQVSCLVDGCRADLSGCRDYHRRHRVCETHSKTPVVTICGKEQRFCQQCSRFHSLGEFDEVKRSCRKRLDGHNRRRRKARPESMYFNYGSFFTSHQGTKLLHFGGSPATTFGDWREKHKLNHKFQVTAEQRTPSDSFAHFCSVRKRRFPFLLGVDSEKVNQSFSKSSFQQVVNTNPSSGHLLVEPKGVLYLLSNSKHTIHNSSLPGPTNNLVQFNGMLSQHSGPHLLSQDVTRPNSGHTNNQLIGMIRFRSEGLLENEAAQVLSFSWD